MIKELYTKGKQFIKFGIVGLCNNIIFLIIYYLLIFIKLDYLISNICGYLLSSIFGYIVNRIWVFNAINSRTKKSLPRYYIVYATAFLINIGCMYLLVDIFNISDKIAPYFVLCITIPYNFILSKLWVYKS